MKLVRLKEGAVLLGKLYLCSISTVEASRKPRGNSSFQQEAPLSGTRLLRRTLTVAFRLLLHADPLKHPSAALLPGVSSQRTFSHAEAHAVITVPSLMPLVKIVVTDALPGANSTVRRK